MGIKEEIRRYLKQQEISEDELIQNLKLEKETFSEESQRELKADEFCEICAYLKMDPWNFYQKKKES